MRSGMRGMAGDVGGGGTGMWAGPGDERVGWGAELCRSRIPFASGGRVAWPGHTPRSHSQVTRPDSPRPHQVTRPSRLWWPSAACRPRLTRHWSAVAPNPFPAGRRQWGSQGAIGHPSPTAVGRTSSAPRRPGVAGVVSTPPEPPGTTRTMPGVRDLLITRKAYRSACLPAAIPRSRPRPGRFSSASRPRRTPSPA